MNRLRVRLQKSHYPLGTLLFGSDWGNGLLIFNVKPITWLLMCNMLASLQKGCRIAQQVQYLGWVDLQSECLESLTTEWRSLHWSTMPLLGPESYLMQKCASGLTRSESFGRKPSVLKWHEHSCHCGLGVLREMWPVAVLEKLNVVNKENILCIYI